MNKHNYPVTFLKKINLLINNLIKKNLNKLNINNLSKISISIKFYIIFITLFILFLSYLSIPNIYDNREIRRELKNQLLNKFSLNFDLPYNLEYNFFPQPHFIYEDSAIFNNKKEISKIKKLKIYFSLNNLFSLKKIRVNDLTLENANFNLDNQNYNFFIKLLSGDFKNSNIIIKDSNIFFRNIDKEVLFINKIINMKYYYDHKYLKNVVVSKNKIFNLPYSLELHNDDIEKKIFSRLNLKFLKLQVENEINYDSETIRGSANFTSNKNKSTVNYKSKKNSFDFNFFNKLDSKDFSYIGEISFNPFYSILKGKAKKIDLNSLFNSNAPLSQLLKTEILNNKNLNSNFNIFANEIKNYKNFENIFFKSKIQEGLIDFDHTQFSWKDNVNFKILDSLMLIKGNELILDGKLDIFIKDSNDVYKSLLTPKNLRTNINKIELSFNYNFDQKILGFNDIKVNNILNLNLNKNFKNLIFKKNKLKNKIYLKNSINEAISFYVG